MLKCTVYHLASKQTHVRLLFKELLNSFFHSPSPIDCGKKNRKKERETIHVFFNFLGRVVESWTIASCLFFCAQVSTVIKWLGQDSSRNFISENIKPVGHCKRENTVCVCSFTSLPQVSVCVCVCVFTCVISSRNIGKRLHHILKPFLISQFFVHFCQIFINLLRRRRCVRAFHNWISNRYIILP